MGVLSAFDRLKDLDELAVAVDVGSGVRSVATRQANALANLGLASGVASPLLSNSPSGGIGYSTGAGAAVTQLTNKSTGVTMNNVTGQITMNNASLAASTTVSFTLTNSTIGAFDCPDVVIASGGTAGAYNVQVDAVAAGSCRISVRNNTAGALAEALVLNFANFKGANA